MKKVNCTIKGTAPLLMHKLGLDVEAQLDSKTKKRAGACKDDDPKSFLYTTLSGMIYQPAEHIYQAICKRLGDYKIQGRGKKSYKELGKGALDIKPECIPHKNQTWITDIRTVVIPATKGRMIRKRPRFDEWELSFTIEIINPDLPVEVIKNALDDAGREGGLGDYRPRFGRFMVTEFKEV